MSEFRLNEQLCAVIKLYGDKGEETMSVQHDSIDILRLRNLIEIFSMGRFKTDVRMTVDIAYPDSCEHGVRRDRQCGECSNEHPSLP